MINYRAINSFTSISGITFFYNQITTDATYNTLLPYELSNFEQMTTNSFANDLPPVIADVTSGGGSIDDSL